MNEYSIKTVESKHEELDKYLSQQLIDYGVAEAGGNRPKYIYCSIKDSQGNYIAGIKGYAILNLFYISQLFVDKKHRNIGLGNKLLTEIENVAINHGCNTMRLDTLNNKSHSFYTKYGFEKTLEIKEYMKGFDLLFFHKHINSSI